MPKSIRRHAASPFTPRRGGTSMRDAVMTPHRSRSAGRSQCCCNNRDLSSRDELDGEHGLRRTARPMPGPPWHDRDDRDLPRSLRGAYSTHGRFYEGRKMMKPIWVRLMSTSALAMLMSTGLTSAQTMDKLIADAKGEGQLTVIALPHDWCGYGAVIDGFKSKYGLKVNELNPDAGSGDEVEAIKANKGNTGPQAPDVIDVGLSFGPTVKKDGLVQPYKVSTWSTIPDSAKDADGYWYGDYYGVLAFEINADLVKKIPADWPDLLAADYKNAVALAGDPRVSNQAIQAVFAAGLASANGDVAKAG